MVLGAEDDASCADLVASTPTVVVGYRTSRRSARVQVEGHQVVCCFRGVRALGLSSKAFSAEAGASFAAFVASLLR